MFACAAHDLKTPLNSISIQLQIAQHLNLNEEIKQNIENSLVSTILM